MATSGGGDGGRILIIGASLAGMNAAQMLRRSGYQGTVTVVGEEHHRPYDRPPLSKEFLTGDLDLERIVLAPARRVDELDIELLLGRRATALDLDRSEVTTRSTGDDPGSRQQQLGYDGLIIATGSRARALPDAVIEGRAVALEGLFSLRNLGDAQRLKTSLSSGSEPVVICGAGFIGGEVAASARTLGREVILVEAADAPLTRVLDAEAGMVMADLHRRNGVDVRLSTTVEVVRHDGTRVVGVALSDGSEITTSVIVVGIGAIPNTEWLQDSGVSTDDGVAVDPWCRADTMVMAAGDVARFPNARFGGMTMRIEQWDNAVEMGRFAAAGLLADLGLLDSDATVSSGYAPVPWFWSDQYDCKIQLAGVRSDEAVMARGSVHDHQFVRLYHNGDTLCGVLAWNRPRQAIIGRQLIEQGSSVADARERLGG
ncbi:MAG: FAD-dependent oxidoreductase [Acidimicrobiia bacterium]|nr:FAD-dependent oxidoreductase [Acidimicrobiia bacterium]